MERTPMHPTRARPPWVFSFLSSVFQRLWLMCDLKISMKVLNVYALKCFVTVNFHLTNSEANQRGQPVGVRREAIDSFARGAFVLTS
jgi:hypothetical protein